MRIHALQIALVCRTWFGEIMRCARLFRACAGRLDIGWELMIECPSFIERAFALAESGQCGSLASVREQLKAEGYSEAGHLSGPSIRSQLKKIIAANKSPG